MTAASSAVGPADRPVPAPARATARAGRPARAVRAARRAEFDDLVVRLYPLLVAEAAMLVDDRRRAESLVRRGLALLWRDWARAREHENPAELVRVWVHEQTARDGQRRRWWRRRPAVSTKAAGDTLVALRAMPQVQRRAVVLHHGTGRTLEQIAALEGVSAQAVRMRLAHGAHAMAHHHPATPTIPISISPADLEGDGPVTGADR